MNARPLCHLAGLDASVLVPWYARSGLPVIPLHAAPGGSCTCGKSTCASPGKHPRTRRGVYDATVDLGDIAEMLAVPLQSYGLAVPPDVVVVDEDPRNGGDRSIARLEHKYGAFPETLMARTGGGGSHRWYVHSGPVRSRLAEGVDIKHEGGFVVVPPSVHASGNSYEWISAPDAGIAHAPQWLAQLLAPPRPTPIVRCAGTARGSLGGLVQSVATAKSGNRNSILYWAARRAIDGGHLELGDLAAAGEAAGLATSEVQATIASARRGAGARVAS